ncbi:MAG: DUF885 domain-containing protein [Actinomycetota bacterium]
MASSERRPRPPTTETTTRERDVNAERASALADRYWEQLLELEPVLGTVVGDERFDDRLSDPGEKGRSVAASVNRGALAELGAIDRSALDESLRGTLDVLEASARRSLADLDHRADRLRAASHFWGPITALAEIASMQSANTPERLERYVHRLHGFQAYLQAWADVAREGVAAGVTSPRIVVERAIGQLERLLALPPEDSPAVAPAGDDVAARERIAAVVRNVVNPAFQRYLGTIREYLPHATESIGLSQLPDGDAMYAAAILSWTTLPLGAQEVHDLGVERYEAIQQERRDIASRLGVATVGDAIAAHHASGENTASSREEMLVLARAQVERSWDAAPRFFGKMPEANCEVRPVEEYREGDTPLGFYNPPTEDGSRAGVYYINTSDLDQRPLHHVASLTYHEANPGHHFQISIEQQMSDRPALRRFGGILAGSAFCEGWGLYSERLADEMDLYLDDWERLGMLEAQGLRAGRLVTDTGIHALGWSRERAVTTLEEIGVPSVDAAIEVDRYIAIPGQALAYMVGMIEIVNARRAAEEREGSAFSLPDFHDRMLALGQLPLPALRRELG